MECSVRGCTKQRHGKHYCQMHYKRLRNTGSLESKKKESLQERFEKNIVPEPMSGCWLWEGARDGAGYGSMSYGDGINKIRSHRAAYILYNGPIEEDFLVLHKCHNKLCANPDHLYLGTAKQNRLDSIKNPANKELAERVKRNKQKIEHWHSKGFGPSKISNLTGLSRGAVRSYLSGDSGGWIDD